MAAARHGRAGGRGSLRRDDDRSRYVARHALLRTILGEELGIAPAGVPLDRAPCPLCGGPHGRPIVAGEDAAALSLAATAGVVAVAAAPAGVEVGVDVEATGRVGADDLVAALHPREQAALARSASPDLAALRCWTRKEALLKGLGTGLGVDPAGVHVGWRRRPSTVPAAGRPPRPARPVGRSSTSRPSRRRAWSCHWPTGPLAASRSRWSRSGSAHCWVMHARRWAGRGLRVGSVEHVVMDLEASCWEAAWVRHRMETIEIGAVRLDGSLQVVDEFDSFVRPVAFPRLSSFCRKLTSITQEQVDAADTFPKAFARFVTWMGSGPRRLVTWGAFDLGQLRMDCERHGMVFPAHLERDHLNLKTAFGKWKGLKRVGMPEAMDLLDLPPLGHAHRGIDDARNLARIVQVTLPHLPAG